MQQDVMYDREMKEKFILDSGKLSEYRESNKWFGRNSSFEPIWITNQRAGKDRFSLTVWPGAEYMWDNKASFWINNYMKIMSEYENLATKIVETMCREKEPVNFVAIYLNKLGKYLFANNFFNLEVLSKFLPKFR